MRKLLLIMTMLLSLSFAEGLVEGNAYIISAIGVNNGGKVVWQSGDSNKISDGEYKLAPQVVIYDGKSYIGAATPFTGCLNNRYYLEGADQNIPCMTGVENSLNSSDTSKALSAAKGKDLQAQIDNLTAIVETLQSNPGVDFKSVYPIGSIYISTDGTNPADLFSGTQWEAIGQGRTLIGAGTGKDNNGTQKTFNSGEIGGEYSHKLLTSEMPSHNHGASASNSGVHSHNASTGSSGSHTHTFRSQNDDYNASCPGTHQRGFVGDCNDGYHTHSDLVLAAGDHTHTVSIQNNGAHSHTITVNNTGGNGFHNNIQPYLTVYMWKRIS